jgi:hypothetical protein
MLQPRIIFGVGLYRVKKLLKELVSFFISSMSHLKTLEDEVFDLDIAVFSGIYIEKALVELHFRDLLAVDID